MNRDEIIDRMGNIADAALTQYHHVGYADRINMMWEALQQISAERIEYVNNAQHLPRHKCAECGVEYHGIRCPVCHNEIREAI